MYVRMYVRTAAADTQTPGLCSHDNSQHQKTATGQALLGNGAVVSEGLGGGGGEGHGV